MVEVKQKKFLSYFIASLPYLLCFLFFIAYSTLSIVRHNHYQSYGYDLGINDQTVWRYSTFQLPISTISPLPDRTKLAEHVELVYAFISPFYWIWSTRRMLLMVEVAFLVSGGIAVFLQARYRKISYWVSIALLFSYLTFFGVQNAVWFDVHSASFGAAFLAWFIYFLDKKNRLGTFIFFFLAITAKENIAFITFFIALVYGFWRKDRMSLVLGVLSFSYLFFIFFIYFPHIIRLPYLYQNNGGILSNLNPLSMFDTAEKLQTEFYTLFSYGFLSLLSPLTLIPVLGDLATYFVFGSDLTGAQGLFMHYRVTLAPLLSWSAISAIHRYGFLNKKYIAVYLVFVACFIQFFLHLPLSYLTKSWFWQEPTAVNNINTLIREDLPRTASVVSQNNITPHISHRDKIYTLYPEQHTFTAHSPCGKNTCEWFRWFDHPEYLIVDTSSDWDARHLLIDHDPYVRGLVNLEKAGVITKYKQINTATLYKVNENPDDYH